MKMIMFISVEKGLFDKNGAQWVKCTSECLIQKLFDIYEVTNFILSKLLKSILIRVLKLLNRIDTNDFLYFVYIVAVERPETSNLH